MFAIRLLSSESEFLLIGALALAVVLALLRGGKPERAGAIVLCAMVALQVAGQPWFPPMGQRVDPLSLAVDALGLIGFGAIAVNAVRNWTMVAAASQMLTMTAHFARFVDFGVTLKAYAYMRAGPVFLVAVMVIVGTLCHWWRVRGGAFDPDWRTPYPRR